MQQGFLKYRNDYGSFHTKRFTFLTHLIGVPLIFLGIQLFLNWLRISLSIELTLAWAGWFGLSIFYLFLAGRSSLMTILILALLTGYAQHLATPFVNIYSILLGIVFLLVGALCQWWGHAHEGKKPAFVDNFMHVFIAPLFLMTELQIIFMKLTQEYFIR